MCVAEDIATWSKNILHCIITIYLAAETQIPCRRCGSRRSCCNRPGIPNAEDFNVNSYR